MNTEKTYWLKQADKHAKTATTLMAKYRATGEARWLKQAQSNQAKAIAIRARWRHVD
jgi:hypothetical protein